MLRCAMKLGLSVNGKGLNAINNRNTCGPAKQAVGIKQNESISSGLGSFLNAALFWYSERRSTGRLLSR